MFYPVDSLKRGGRFYLCWIADSWPLRFEKLTHRNQRLWSQDIREICDALQELMTNESGRPTHRFSLRLSSQLMRGLARIYQKKVELFVRDMWRINSNVIRYRSHQEPNERAVVPRRRAVVGLQRLVIEEQPDEVNVEKLIENADNLVAREEDITLREPTLPEMRLIDDGFGELNQEPVEMMLAQEVSAMQQSALDLPLDYSTDKSQDKSRLVAYDAAQMERISEHDISVFRKSAGEAPTLMDFEKEIPDISEIPPSEMPAPEPQNQVLEQPLEEAQVLEPHKELPSIQQAEQESEQIVLEYRIIFIYIVCACDSRYSTLTTDSIAAMFSLIKRTLDDFEQGIQNAFPSVTLTEEFKDVLKKELLLINARLRFGFGKCWSHNGAVWIIVNGTLLKVVSESDLDNVLINTSTDSARDKATYTISSDSEDLEDEPQQKRRKLKNRLLIDKTTKLSSNYLRARIGNDSVELRCQDTSEDVMTLHTPAAMLLGRPTHSGPWPLSRFGHTLSSMFSWRLANTGRTPAADRDVEEPLTRRPTMHLETVGAEIQAETSANKSIQGPEVQDHVIQDISNIDISARNIPEVDASILPAQDAIEMADLPTQKLLTISQEQLSSELEKPPKKRRLSQRARPSLGVSAAEANKENIPVAVNMPAAENIPANIPLIVLPVDETEQQSNVETLTSMLQVAGLADAQEKHADVAIVTQRERRTNGSDGSQTPLGSLDRTKVSLGDSEKTTDSKRFINEEWGTQGTMFKIFRCVVKKVPRITVDNLVRRGPVIEGRQRIIAARCFSSILKLKNHWFIKIIKNEETNEIKHIELGPRITEERDRYVK
ncbi:uncharacterized protein LOC120627431 [Pararge aegeria]|uniref:uncharacterized protein LOC120627431 n=1 Tax=Pararge aegeria TaxID=116150 RepID=UPI0019CFA406|nr:uncharacterized protein LOC120627431 [Pararge aegeria]